MRVNIILILLSVTLLAVCTLSVIQTVHTMDDLLSLAQQAIGALPDDVQAAQAALSALEETWQRKEKHWQLFAIHEDLNAVTLELMRSRNALQSGNLQAAGAALDELLITLENLRRKELPSPGNIF